jgi:hypothetical protein
LEAGANSSMDHSRRAAWLGNGLHYELDCFGKMLEPSLAARSTGERALPGRHGFEPLDEERAGPRAMDRGRDYLRPSGVLPTYPSERLICSRLHSSTRAATAVATATAPASHSSQLRSRRAMLIAMANESPDAPH